MPPMSVEHHALGLQKRNEVTLERIHVIGMTAKKGFSAMPRQELDELKRAFEKEALEARKEFIELKPTGARIPNPQLLPYTTIRMMLLENLLRELYKAREMLIAEMLRKGFMDVKVLPEHIAFLKERLTGLEKGSEEHALVADEIRILESRRG